jgi:hypothetical protein
VNQFTSVRRTAALACSRGRLEEADTNVSNEEIAMSAQVDLHVIRILEEAGERYLGETNPQIHRALLLHVGAGALRRYEPVPSYWERVQAVLDCFFDSAERAQICAELMVMCNLRARPEARCFFDRALAEIRLQQLARSAARRAISSEIGAHQLR